jgi:TPR repeat protein
MLAGAASSGAAQGAGDRAKKALSGDVSAQISLGESYRLGLGVDQNYAEARRFYKLAAAQGAPQAQFALAEMNRFGEGAKRLESPRRLRRSRSLAALRWPLARRGEWSPLESARTVNQPARRFEEFELQHQIA